jgi:putative nucleotidyltransferase with HDIG domain
MFSLLVSLTLFAVSSLTPFSFLFAFLSGVTSTFVVVGAERRIDLIRASLELAIANSLILVVFGFSMNYEFSWFLVAIGWGALNGFLCGILNLGLLPIFEHLMNAPTPFRLMELSDMNSPMLKRMLTLAPGTYGHSVSVANLAESACRAIGANALLARVGAYYHDIGKVDQSEYFIENQTSGNVHDDLKPSLSAAVIKSHVKIGIERAKELGLPKEVIEIIAQHHGSGLISYFYIQALKNQKESKVQPEDFSYTGVPPTSREAAVVMLADTVEAASRTLKKPTVAKLERFIWSSIIEKFTSGQMNDSDLTFRDLETIKKTFLQILAGHFHSRIEYPDRKEAVK